VAELGSAGGDGELAAAWATIRDGLRRDCGARLFDHWLKPLTLGGIAAPGVVRLHVPSDFMANWVSTHYADRLTLAWRAARPGIHEVRIERMGPASADVHAAETGTQAAAMPAVVPAEPGPAGPAATKAGVGRLQQLFDPRLTFERFLVGPSNQVARNATLAMAAVGRPMFSPLYIQGATGQGKTHLMHAIANARRAADPDAAILYMSAEKFMTEFVAAMRARDTLSFKTRLRSADLLLIDDIQFIAGKDTTQEEFLHTIDELIGAGRGLVVSADRSPHALTGVECKLQSRLAQGLVADVKPADLPLRRAILATKATTLPEGLVVPEAVLDCLAVRIASNIRELEGALNRLAAYATLTSRAIDVAFAEDVLSESFSANQRRVTIDEIQRKVSEHFDIRMTEMVSARRARAVARPRQIAMYLAKRLTPRSLPEIGRKFGGRDHTTVIHAVRQIEKLRASDSEIDADVRSLLLALEGA